MSTQTQRYPNEKSIASNKSQLFIPFLNQSTHTCL